MATLAERIEARGEVRGLRAMLQEQLESIFGPLPEDARERIAGAPPEQLKSWARSLGTTLKPSGISIDDVLGGTAR